jgi:hypothetical protein
VKNPILEKLFRVLLFLGAVGASFLTVFSARADDPLLSDIVMININGFSGTLNGSGGAFTFTSSSSFSTFGSFGGLEYAPAFAGPFGLPNGAVLLYDDPSQTVVSDQIWVQDQFLYFASDNGLQDLQSQGIPVIGGLLETPGQAQDVSSFFGLDAGSIVVASDVPEPGAVAVAAVGVACSLLIARRRK